MARDFDGTDDKVEATDPNIGTTGPLTVCAWVQPQTAGADGRCIWGYGDRLASRGFILKMQSTRTISFRTAIGAFVDSAGTIGLDVWSHVAVRKEGSGTATHAIFINGVPDGSGNLDAPTAQNSTDDFRLGAVWDNDDTGTGFWDGFLAEFMFWNTNLSDDEIAMAMRGYIPQRDNLQVYWPVWGTVSPEPDFSGGNRHGTLTGTAAVDHPPKISAIWHATLPKRFQRVGAIISPVSEVKVVHELTFRR